ncbi:MAG: haloacid dehalogenase type II [Gammaproteobacteria bacterium]|nr:haloacid dehalogenase type II [Gammaproteobacteria bacterium]
MTTTIKGVSVCVFDAYGTIFDVHSAVRRNRERIGHEADEVSRTWRAKQIEYSWLRALMGRYVDLWQVTQEALDFAMAKAKVTDIELRDDLLNAYMALDAYPEVERVLSRLRSGGIRTAILSNGSPLMLEAAVQSSGLGHVLDDVLSVDEVRTFKPHPDVYQLVVDRLHVEPDAVCYHSSNSWDALAATGFGFRAAWINRFGDESERLPEMPDVEMDSLEGLPAIVLGSEN